MAKKIINATGAQTSFNYGVNGARLYFNYYVTYEEPSGAGTINPSTLSTTLVYQKPGPLNTVQYVESARLRADGTWLPLKENEARVINPPSPGNPNGSIGNVVNPNSSNYILGASTINELTAKGPNTLNYAARQNAAAVVNKSTSLTLNQVNQAYYISQSTAPGGAQINPVLPLSPALPAAPPLSPDPGADPNSGGGADPLSGAEVTTYENSQRLFADNKALLKYPLNQSSEVYDYIRIQPVDYVAGLNDINTPQAALESVRTRIKNTGIYPTIFLPMTPSISETNSVGWGADELNPVQAAFGQAAMNAIDGLGANPTFDALKDALGNITGAAIDLANQPGLSKFISAYFAGQAVQANLLGRAGIVINPNLELLFQGPKLRSFRYNFRFTPRDDKEAKEIRRIIRVFKKSMAVRRTSSSLFLAPPAVYEIKYIFKGNDKNQNRDHPFLNKIKPCALTAFNVNYAPDGSYMTYQDGSMTSYTVDMQFDELEPIYNEDISQDLESETMDF